MERGGTINAGWWQGLGRVLSTGLVLSACQAPPAPKPVPGPYEAPAAMLYEQDTYRGTILSGPLASHGVETPKEGFAWNAQVAFLERYPEPPLASLSARMAMVTHTGQANPVLGAPVLLVGGQWTSDAEAVAAWQGASQGTWGRFGTLAITQGQTPADRTSLLSWTLPEEEPDPDNFLQEWPKRNAVTKRLSIALEATAQTLQPGLFVEDLGLLRGNPEEQDAPLEGGRPDGPRMQSEWVLPAITLPADGETLLFVVPNPFYSVEAEAIAILLAAERVGGLALTAGETPGTDVGREATPLPALATLARLQTQAAENPRPNVRGPWLYLANLSGAPLTSDLVLTASEEQLQGWIELVPPTDQLNGETWGWALERAAWVHLARLQVKDQLPQEGKALLWRLAGEVGQYPSTIEAAALQSADLETFHRRLHAENLLFLDDSNPGARVRAFDWLAARGVTVPDFDPLGDREARRAALRAMEAGQDADPDSAEAPQ